MPTTHVNQGLFRYIKKHILTQYKPITDGHGIEHIEDVIKWSFKISKKLKNKDKLNKNIIYASTAYHDIGHIYSDRPNHHKGSHDYVLNDKGLKQHLTREEIHLVSKACLEHRASYTGDYTSIYSMIVSDADRCGSLNFENMIIRSYLYTSAINPDYSDDEIFEEVYFHLTDKYGDGGYMSFNLEETRLLKGDVLNYSQEILKDKTKTRELYNKIRRKL